VDAAAVFTTNEAVDWPIATVAEEGTVAEVLLLVSPTTTPPEPAGPLKVTVPVDGLPEKTEVGFKVTETRVAGVTVRLAA
jgi:hypothetical protein